MDVSVNDSVNFSLSPVSCEPLLELLRHIGTSCKHWSTFLNSYGEPVSNMWYLYIQHTLSKISIHLELYFCSAVSSIYSMSMSMTVLFI